jgi:Holliday junction DNA helicase RuvA
MIASLKGKLELIGSEWALVNVGGIGLQVFIPSPTLSELGAIGGDVKLYTHLHLREDNISLYGFATTSQLELFRALINVSGLGPRLALSMLSSMPPEQLMIAIASGNVDLLMGIPGIGKKMANRLVLELKDIIGSGLISAPAAELAQGNADVLAALTTLGYSTAEATRALSSLPRDEDLGLEDKIKLALASFNQE